MDVVGSEIGQKMRSAIKAKLTELGCYVDDELPDYVMVMVANKRTRAQMEDDLQLFLGDNTQLFVNWLHQVLKKLQEVTVTPLKQAEPEKMKDKTKEKKTKEKKVKTKEKKTDLKKVKKKGKKKHRKKEEKKLHKSKKKSDHEQIRPNIPPLLMNIEKESEPSITDVFAGQILKNHGITIDVPKEEKVIEIKPVVKEIKRPILPIIDPATIDSQPETSSDKEILQPTTAADAVATVSGIIPAVSVIETSVSTLATVSTDTTLTSMGAPREEQIKEINDIEIKIQGLKQKLAEQLDSMSDDDADFLNIRTEAEELMNDFAEDVFQEISSQAPEAAVSTPPLQPKQTSLPAILSLPTQPKETPQELPELPHIELKLPKRPIRERLGAKEDLKKAEKPKEKRIKTPERFTPEREPDFWGKHKSAKSRLGDLPEREKRLPISDDSDDSDVVTKKVTSKVSRSSPPLPVARRASVVRVRPRPRVQPARSSLLMRAVADAHKSLLTIAPKVDAEPAKVKRAMVLPMRRLVDTQNIMIHVPQDVEDIGSDGGDKSSKVPKDEYIPCSITKKIVNEDYFPSRRAERTSSRKDDTLIIETINIHNSKVEKDKDTQFIVTMDGFNTNAFLAKKLMTEGLLDNEEGICGTVGDKPLTTSVLKTAIRNENTKNVLTIEQNNKKETDVPTDKDNDKAEVKEKLKEPEKIIKEPTKTLKDSEKTVKERESRGDSEISSPGDILEITSPGQRLDVLKISSVPKKRLSDTSEESDTQVIIKTEKEEGADKRKSESKNESVGTPPTKKKRASPIVFDVMKKEKGVEKVVEKSVEKERVRERTESASSDNHVIVTTPVNSHKYDAVPPLSLTQPQPDRKTAWCRAFPLCRYGALCAFQHPRCKFAAACTRRNCPYSHVRPAVASPIVASHVVPAANYKSISPAGKSSVCKYYPNCVNPACHFYHPKPCRYGLACVNKLECNFYHHDSAKWRHAV